jgi:hypothetical protein
MPTVCEREESVEMPESVPMLTRHTAQRGSGFRQLGHACKKGKGGMLIQTSIVAPDPGSGAFLTPGPGSGIQNRFIPDPGSKTHLELSDKFLGKKCYNSLKTGPNFFLQHFKNKIILNFVKFVATKKGMATNFFHPSLC